MVNVAFVLSMPNVGSWNGKWTGEGNLYAVVKKFSDRWFEKNKEKFINGGYYNFGDGWGASIDVKVISSLEAKTIRKKSRGFYGYEWMVDSLMWYGEILNTKERREQVMSEADSNVQQV